MTRALASRVVRGRARVGIELGVLVGAVTVAVSPTPAVAAPIELVEPRGQYWLFDDVDGSVENAWWFDRPGFYAGYQPIEDGLLAVHPDDSQFIVVYTTWSLPGGIGAFFQSVANDVHGVGFEHIAPEDAVIPEPYFDDTPSSQVQGFLNMNRWTQYLGDDPGGTDDTVVSLIFGQELGHAWGSFVYYSQGGGPWTTNLLGRANAHWSFYMDSGGSPMQGHRWTDNGDGTFTASKTDVYVYSDLDLYLMGLLPAEDVAPWFVVEDPYDCFDAAAGDDVCAPVEAFTFEADTYTVGGTRRDVTIEDVLAVEGARVPAWPDAPDEFDVSFVMIKRPDEVLSEDELAAIDVIVGRSVELFEVQTRGLGRVINRTASEEPPGGETGGVDESGGGEADGTASGGGSGGPGRETDGPGGSGGGTASEGSGGAAADGGEGDQGCACASGGSGSGGPGTLAWAGLLVLGARGARGRRRSARA